MARIGNKKTAPAVISAKERAAEALRLRKAGCGFDEIARKAGYASRQAAHDAVRRAIREILREPVEELVALDVERLDQLWQANFPAALEGDAQALAGCLRIMERRAKLLGLDAAAQKEQEQAERPQTVMLVPHFATAAEWERAAVEQQAKLKRDVRN
jgi:hypothetical protein